MSDDPKCVAGCVPFYGGEKRHHKDCPYYPESLTKLNADRIEELEAKLKKAVDALETISKQKVGPDFDWTEDEVNRWRAVWYRKYADIARTTLAELTGGKDE